MMPPMQLLGVWLEPRVEVVVALNSTGDCVTITVCVPSTVGHLPTLCNTR